MAKITCAIGLSGNIAGMRVASTLLAVPRGTLIRPMRLFGFLVLIALGTAVVGLPLGVRAVASGRRRAAGWMVAALRIVLSLMPLFSSALVIDWIVAWKGRSGVSTVLRTFSTFSPGAWMHA
jgi:hypothetical protein